MLKVQIRFCNEGSFHFPLKVLARKSWWQAGGILSQDLEKEAAALVCWGRKGGTLTFIRQLTENIPDWAYEIPSWG